tara:strand:+ start:1597 stop:2523 length:927 start_codon:yes stop_codon:yes gene_type:complete
MKKKKIYIFFVIILFFQLNLYAKKSLNIIAKIDNELITSYDVKNKIITTLVLSKKELNQENINSLKKIALENLIINRLKKIELNKYDIKSNDRQINAYLNSISSNDIPSLEKSFEINGLDFKAYKNELDIEFKWRNLIFNKYSNKINIDPDDLIQQLPKKIEQQESSIEFNLSEIEILSSDPNLEKEIIPQILEEIKQTGFENAVLKFSIASSSSNQGNLGWINSNSLSEDLLEIIEKLEVGEVTKPIKKNDKIIFFKLIDKKIISASSKDIENLKKELIEQKKNELFRLYSSSFLSKLRNSKLIEYY